MATTDPLHRAYVLHSRPYRESSLLVDVLSEEYGRIGVVARVGGKTGGQKKAQLQPFCPLHISISGRSSLKNLATLEAPTLPLPLSGSALYSGLYLNELCQRLLVEEQPVDGVFDGYHQALIGLAKQDRIEVTLRQFELVLLQQLGHLPEPGHDSAGNVLSEHHQYDWQPEFGWTLLPDGNASGVSGLSLLRWQQNKLEESSDLRQIKRVTRTILKPLLGNKPLQSRAFFKKRAQ